MYVEILREEKKNAAYSRGRTKGRGGPAEQLPGAPTCNGRYVTGIIGSMGLVNLGYHTRKNCSDNYPQFGHAPSKMFASPTVGRKNLNNTGFKGRRIIQPPGTLICLGPAVYIADCFGRATNTPQRLTTVFLIPGHCIWCIRLYLSAALYCLYI
jgi:hypothetical protein